jgi:hypothetical protein
MQSLLLHLLESAHLTSLLLPRKIHFTITSLADLRNDMELIDPKFGASLSEKYPLTSTI